MRRKLPDSFTLIELLVVIAVISILITILLPALQRAKEMGRRAVCRNNMKQVYLAGNNYALDYDGRFPLTFYYSMGDNRECSSLNRPSTNYWVMNYLNIPLYTTWYRWGNTKISDYAQTGYFHKPDSRTVLACPGSAETDYKFLTHNFDYFIPGFGLGRESNIPHTRISSIAKPVNGFPKLMIVDNCWRDPSITNAFRAYTYWNCHRPNSPEGINAMATDGSIKWCSINNTYPMATNMKRRLPKGYYTRGGWSNKYQTIMTIYDQTGVRTNATYDTNPSLYNRWFKEWY